MKTILIKTFVFTLFVVSFATAGCSKAGSSASAPLASAKIPAAMNQAFDQSSGETKQMAANYVSTYQGNDIPAAFVGLEKLCARNDLTPSQRSVAARAMATTMEQLRTAAESGNSSAQALLHQYLSSR